MRRDRRAYLWDAGDAADAIERFTRDLDFAAFLANELVRAAVERQFEIIGEALSQLAKAAPEAAAAIPDLRRIIAFRNLLIHGYAAVDHATVWDVIHGDLPALRVRLRALLAEDPPERDA